MDFLPRVELVSEQRSDAIVTGAGWTLVSEWEMVGEVTLHAQTAQGSERWTAEAGFAVDAENLRAAEFTAATCSRVTEAAIEASLMAVVHGGRHGHTRNGGPFRAPAPSAACC